MSRRRNRHCVAAERPFARASTPIAFARGTLIALATMIAPAAAAVDCAEEAQTLSQEEAQLPRLEIASPRDRPPYCITLETLMVFAGRVKLHVAHCPETNYAAAAAQWTKTQTDYSKLFSQYRCKRTMGQIDKPIRARNAR